ncbi:hypothetical protein ACFQFQ_17905 [Sulfitobacter porphyrae]|uniref:Uncharacterized protein n=1 Tax=Sulfitobacter porphyrae TaxID=1246864 RepID=A0ABW2B7B6_9RHOB
MYVFSPFSNKNGFFSHNLLNAIQYRLGLNEPIEDALQALLVEAAKAQAYDRLGHLELPQQHLQDFVKAREACALVGVQALLDEREPAPPFHLDPTKCLIALAAYWHEMEREPAKRLTVCRRVAKLLGPGISEMMVKRALHRAERVIGGLLDPETEGASRFVSRRRKPFRPWFRRFKNCWPKFPRRS